MYEYIPSFGKNSTNPTGKHTVPLSTANPFGRNGFTEVETQEFLKTFEHFCDLATPTPQCWRMLLMNWWTSVYPDFNRSYPWVFVADVSIFQSFCSTLWLAPRQVQSRNANTSGFFGVSQRAANFWAAKFWAIFFWGNFPWREGSFCVIFSRRNPPAGDGTFVLARLQESRGGRKKVFW